MKRSDKSSPSHPATDLQRPVGAGGNPAVDGGLGRRRFIGAVVIGGPLALAAGSLGLRDENGSNARREKTMSIPSVDKRMPVSFLGHGAPTLALDPVKGADFRRWGERLPRPSAILMVSAHWQDAPITLSATRPVELVYDFYGFPDALYQLRHDAPPAPALADRVEALLEGQAVRRSERGLDHGAWVPLIHLDPEARIPVLQVSMPASSRPDQLLAMGRTLAPLRDEGVWIVGSGNIVHNLRRVDFSGRSAPPAWAAEFDEWAKDALDRGDVDALADHRIRAPGSNLAHPTDEHFRPLLVALGAAGSDLEKVKYEIEGFEYGSISRRSLSFG